MLCEGWRRTRRSGLYGLWWKAQVSLSRKRALVIIGECLRRVSCVICELLLLKRVFFFTAEQAAGEYNNKRAKTLPCPPHFTDGLLLGLGTLVAVETAEGERECRLFAERRRGAQQAPRPAVDPGASRGLSSCSRAFKKPLEAAGSRKTLLWPDRRLINGLLGNGRCDGCTE
ncbi:hypothetical protein H105_00264 [Trichophyton soudanense CBS 452.61]|uniref:Uncharacterized protein n=1 Tax=Trichophyton soudanense CBS 452.61 TaxID=1215331 RepID=A0A022Y8G8_TRISD|nr:hypothetical protein H105_00264 [Trichophyton soudanense CBS 452.61]EZF89381.1 hypothetical protein H110_00274 [Trichophyton rubrum MR1448]